MERVLFRFSKGDTIRFVGHLDLMRAIERAMRRSGFPIAYSQGFNPRPRMAFASALTLGATSDWELCQLDLARDLDRDELGTSIDGLRAQLPQGLAIHEVWPIPLEKRNPYIQVSAAEYTLTLGGEASAEQVTQFLDLGVGLPQALECVVHAQSDPISVRLKLPVGERGGVRIRDLVAVLEQAIPGLRVTRLHRARLWCELDPGSHNEIAGDGMSDSAGTARPVESTACS